MSKDICRVSGRTAASIRTRPSGSCRRPLCSDKGNLHAQLVQILNPILHAQDPEGVERYRVEPYVLAGDVYSGSPYAGRGGWTWYTGSASWYYQTILESILGFRRAGRSCHLSAVFFT